MSILTQPVAASVNGWTAPPKVYAVTAWDLTAGRRQHVGTWVCSRINLGALKAEILLTFPKVEIRARAYRRSDEVETTMRIEGRGTRTKKTG